MAPVYAELHALSNFTFLRGASHPEELVLQAAVLGYAALAITDECSVAGVVRAHVKLRELKEDQQPHPRLIIGSEFRLACGLKLVALAIDRQGYGKLSRLITRGRRAAGKGSYALERADLQQLEHCLVLWIPGQQIDFSQGEWIRERFGGNAWIAVELLYEGPNRQRLEELTQVGQSLGLPLVAAGDVHMHSRERRQLQDALTAIHHNVPIAEAGRRLYQNGERHLRPPAALARIYPPQLLAETLAIAARCTFNLDELKYEYPRELVPAGLSAAQHLRNLVELGARRRWPDGLPAEHRDTIERELTIIGELHYEPYFLTVQDIVAYARDEGILCQGRGSAANSLVCYCLGVTSVDPKRGAALLFERFLSRERREPPDIDIDFEHERREEVMQYVYRKYGRARTAIAATVIRYRPRSALRDLARVFGFDPQEAQRLAGVMQWWDAPGDVEAHLRAAGFDVANPALQHILRLTPQLMHFPRHLSQHTGGFVISAGLLEELVPIENARMKERTVTQWDKDDLNDLGILKVDILALGMLTALQRCFDLVNTCRGGEPRSLGELPAEDAKVYEMIGRADTVGVFQIESRAQMSMLPRLQPKCFYDLIVEVAIVRPGPIQGDMVHPYLRRREGEEAVTYPSPQVQKVLERTLGVPIFQEQVMQLAMVAAGFTADEADRLRRAMAAWKRRGGLEPFREKLINGMLERGYEQQFAERIFRQMLGFGEYGFPESHAASFALLVYDSAYLKCHEPAAFTCALLNSQPMGFYQPAQLVRDAREHGVEVRPVDINESEYHCTLERREDGEPALRLGLCLVRSLAESGARRVVAARRAGAFTSVQDSMERAALDRGNLEALAAAGAFAALSGNRHLAFWEVAGAEKPLPLAPAPARDILVGEGHPLLRLPTEAEEILADYRAVGLTLGRHPLALLREELAHEHLVTAAELKTLPTGQVIRTAGIVLMRQRPQTASGVTFVTIEDETGQTNLIVWKSLAETQRRPLLESRLLEVRGELQREKGIVHVIAKRLVDRSALLGSLLARSRDFH